MRRSYVASAVTHKRHFSCILKMATCGGVGFEPKTNQDTDADQKENEGDQNSNFECNICLDVAKDAVVSLCGHLFWLVFLFIVEQRKSLEAGQNT